MNTDDPAHDIPATPEYVLEVLRDERRHQCAIDPYFTDPGVELTFDTTIRAWRDSGDLLDWPLLGKSLNKSWRIHCTRSEWRRAMMPEKHKTLRHICDLIALKALRPTIRPATLLGKPCAAAGAFLAVRARLARAGANADAIAPSTPLASMSQKHWHSLLHHACQLAPGALAPLQITIESPSPTRLPLLGMFSGLAVLMTGLISHNWQCIILGLPTFTLAWTAHGLVSRFLPACVSVTFGEVRTFGDLARALAATPASDLAIP
jgi:hypothetical protein